jgi:hypothetical protein
MDKEKTFITPVLVFVYNRPSHTLKTLEALSLNEGAEKTDVIIYSDGARGEFDTPDILEVRKICKEIKGFKTVSVIERERNFGLAANIINGVSHEIKKYGSVIVLEDDLISSKGFLRYMNEALQYYRESTVFSICAYSPKIQIPRDYLYSTYLSPRIGSWGWASWEDKWKQVDWELSDFDEFIAKRNERKKFESGGNDLTAMLLKQKLGKINSWAIRFTYTCFKLNYRVVYPVKSLIQNKGADGTGTHMKTSNKYESETGDTIDSTLFCPVNSENTEILRQFRLFYSTSLIRVLINFVKLRAFLLTHGNRK